MKNDSQHKKHGFNVPENYFETLEDSILHKVKAIESKESLLVPYKGKHGYIVPESYFENLGDNILQKTPTEIPKVIPLFSWKKIAYSAIGIAAMFLLFFTLYTPSPTIKTNSLASIDSYLLQEYIENDELDDFSLFEIEDLLLDQNIDIIAWNTDTLQDELLYEYLDDRIETEYILTE